MIADKKTVWIRILFDDFHIVHATEKAVLLELGTACSYPGYQCWIPRKFVHSARYALMHELSLPSTFEVALRRDGHEVKISPEWLERYIGFSSEDDELLSDYEKKMSKHAPFCTIKHVPAKLEPVKEVDIDASLVR